MKVFKNTKTLKIENWKSKIKNQKLKIENWNYYYLLQQIILIRKLRKWCFNIFKQTHY